MKPLIKTTRSNVNALELSILDGAITIPIEYLRARSMIKETSTMLVSGSLIEGTGTIHSDIDCIVLCESRPTADEVAHANHALVTDIDYRYLEKNHDVHNTTDFYGNSSIHIDIDYITFEELNNVITKIERIYADIVEDQRVLYSPILLERENNVIHRILTGYPIFNGLLFEKQKLRIPTEKHMYVAHREKLPVFYAFQDVQGCWQSESLWMGCEIARDMMLKVTMSLTHLAGITSKHPKWVYSNLYRIEGHKEIKTDFFRLARKGASTPEQCRHYIEDALNYIDNVFIAIQKLISNEKSFPTQESALNALNNEFNSRKHTTHKISTCEYYFRKKYFAPEDTPSLIQLLKEWD